MCTIQQFDKFLIKFKQSEQWQTMLATVENSPWHREANVAVHTEMVMRQYRERFMPHRTQVEAVIALTALLFHDTGKPVAEEVLEKKDGSGETYRRYAGHEQSSAVTFQECYLQMPELREMLTPYQARAVRWIIEHHLPYGYKDKVKRQGLAVATFAALAEAGVSYDTFFDCLRSDAAGRISDDHETKLQNVETWISEFRLINTAHVSPYGVQTMFILVGPSGSGKSTWINKRFDPNTDVIISFDTYKDRFWSAKNQDVVGWMAPEHMSPPELDPVAHYDIIWRFANEHKSEFNQFADTQIKNAINFVKSTNGTVFVDAVNASKKKRAKLIEIARQRKFDVVGVEFWNRFSTLIDRQKTRGDKCVPYSSVKRQLDTVCGIWAGVEASKVWLEVETYVCG